MSERTFHDEVKGTWSPYGVGIDCHRDMVWCCIVKADYLANTHKFDVARTGLDNIQ